MVIVGFGLLFPIEDNCITLIVSPLKAIENGQAQDAQEQWGSSIKPLILNSDTNTAQNRHDIACGHYTHVWVSPEILVGDLYLDDIQGVSGSQSQESQLGSSQPKRRIKRSKPKGMADGYRDEGAFSSALQHPYFQKHCRLITIDEMHLCAKTSWGGDFDLPLDN